MLSIPHGGKLVRRILQGEERDLALAEISAMPRLKVNEEVVKDAKNIARGVFSPLEGFMTKLEVQNVVDDCRLPSGEAWTIPVLLDAARSEADRYHEGDRVLLVDGADRPVAILHLEEKFELPREKVAASVFKTDNPTHPGVAELYGKREVFLGGKIDLLDLSREPFPELNRDPMETRELFHEKGWRTVVGFQTRNPVHRAHEYIQKVALEIVDGLFINPVIGKKKTGDFRDELILGAYQKQIDLFYPDTRAVLSIFPTRMHYAGPKEAIHHSIVRKNFGCTHFVVGRDHAGVGDYYGTFEAQEIFDHFSDLGIVPLKLEHSFYCLKCGSVATAKTCPHSGSDIVPPSGTVIRDMIQNKKLVPETIMRREVSEYLISYDEPFVK